MKLRPRLVEKPWGRADLPAMFGDTGNRRIGEVWFEGDPQAALLVKYLFTSQRLSIQVHPDDDAARARDMDRGKDECWLVLDAQPDSELGVGLVQQCSPAELRLAAQNGSIDALIDWRQVHANDFVYNAAGTIHAIGAGLTLVEVQQNTDCTYRLYDYGRDRELHLDEGLAVASMGPHRDPRDRHVGEEPFLRLVDGPHFHLIRARGALPAGVLPSRGALTVVPLKGSARVEGETVAAGECAVTQAVDAIVIDADCTALICWPAGDDYPR